MDSHFDVVIIGAGIAGLYAAYRLLQQATPPISIAITESSARLGGKIYTVTSPKGPANLGAGRYNDRQHPLLARLFSELELATMPHHAVNDAQPSWLNYQTLTTMQQLSVADESVSFQQFLVQHYDNEFVTELRYAGYATLLQDNMPASEALRILIQHPEFSDPSQGQWLEPVAGFGALISQLLQELVAAGVSIFPNTTVELVEQASDIYHLQATASDALAKRCLSAKHVVHATANLEPLTALLSSETAFLHLSKKPVALFKAYFCFTRVWWQEEPNSCQTSSVIRLDTSNPKLGKLYLNASKKMLWIYNDGKAAQYWDKISRQQDFAEQVIAAIATTIGVKIPQATVLLWEHHQFWPRGVDFWCSKSQEQQCQTMRQILSKKSRIHLVASAFAKRSGWIEGALENVEQMLDMVRIDDLDGSLESSA